jgi:predicted N-formylglutamate amidohydrolase
MRSLQGGLLSTLQSKLDDWPEPVEVLNDGGRSDIVLICEHASNHIPECFNGLGLEDIDLERHIAWDIGAESVSRSLSALLDAPCFIGKYSRLLIDLNRPIESVTSIPVRSEATDVPGNAQLSPGDRQLRIDQMFIPFHAAVSAHLDRREKDRRPTKIVAIHSFTPVFLGEARPWDAGILFDKSTKVGTDLIDRLKRVTGLNIGANVPYVIERKSDYAIPVHGEDRGLDAILVEIRQDLIGSAEGQTRWADYLFRSLT